MAISVYNIISANCKISSQLQNADDYKSVLRFLSNHGIIFKTANTVKGVLLLKNKKRFFAGICALVAFVLWTVLVRTIDVRAIGPEGSSVGFAALNGAFHQLTGVHMWLYDLTDLLSVVPLGFVGGFALLGLIQWIKRKQLSKVDRSIFILGGYFIVVLAVFFLFEKLVINYRPILIEGVLEASYPSSTTMLVMCVMPVTMIQFYSRLVSRSLRIGITAILSLFSAFMVIGRLLCGVHWLTDIIGGALLSLGLVMLYCGILNENK